MASPKSHRNDWANPKQPAEPQTTATELPENAGATETDEASPSGEPAPSRSSSCLADWAVGGLRGWGGVLKSGRLRASFRGHSSRLWQTCLGFHCKHFENVKLNSFRSRNSQTTMSVSQIAAERAPCFVVIHCNDGSMAAFLWCT